MRAKATARAKVELEVSLDDHWGDECTVGQIMKQAKVGAVSKVHKIISVARGIDIVGSVEVTAIFVEDK